MWVNYLKKIGVASVSLLHSSQQEVIPVWSVVSLKGVWL